MTTATYTAAEFAELLGVSTWAVYESVKRDECPVRPISLGRRLVWPKAPVDRMLGVTPEDDEGLAATARPVADSSSPTPDASQHERSAVIISDALPQRVTWAAIIAAEPRLADLGMEAVDEHLSVSGPFCANRAWYGRGGYKSRLSALVGWERHRPLIRQAAEAMGATSSADVGRAFNMKELLEEIDQIEPLEKLAYAIDNAAGRGFLWSSEAYSVAYQRVCRSLPDCRDCRDCACWGVASF